MLNFLFIVQIKSYVIDSIKTIVQQNKATEQQNKTTESIRDSRVEFRISEVRDTESEVEWCPSAFNLEGKVFQRASLQSLANALARSMPLIVFLLGVFALATQGDFGILEIVKAVILVLMEVVF